MSNTKNLANLAAALDDGTSGQVLQSTGSGGVQFADSSGSGVTVHANQAAMLTDAASADEGTLHYETGTNKLYVKQTSGFYLLASITNVAPTIDSFSENTGGAGANNLTAGGTFTLTAGSNTVVTINATEPDLETISYSATVTSGTATDVFSSPSFPVSNQSSNVFTLTPVTSGTGGTVTLRFDASDGTNVANVSHSFEIAFQITDSHYTTLLMATDGSAGDNNDITDSSSSTHTITVNGDAHAGTFSPYRHGGYSLYNTSTNHILTSGLTAPGTGDYTLEAWVYITDNSANNVLWDTRFSSQDGTNGSYILFTTNSKFTFGSGSVTYFTTTSTYSTNEWLHVALVRSGTSARLYINGVLGASTSNSTNWNSGEIKIGSNRTGVSVFNGYIRDLRVANEVVYSGAFTPPTGPLTTTGGEYSDTTNVNTSLTTTQLLTCHLPYLADGSSNDHSITVNGSTSAKPFGPYDYDEYASGTDGGSVYFDGNDDLSATLSSAIGTGDFSISGWYYTGATPTTYHRRIFTIGGNNNANGMSFLHQTSGVLRLRLPANVTETHNYSYDAGQWVYFCIKRSSGTLTLHINGEQEYSGSDSTNLSSTSLCVGNDTIVLTNVYGMEGNLADFKISTSSIEDGSVPTSFVSSSGSMLHLKGTDAHVIDKSQGNNLKLVGTAASTSALTSGSTPPYIGAAWAGTSAVSFDGNSDYVIMPQISLGGGDFTIEAYTYLDARLTSYPAIFSNYSSFAAGALGLFAGHGSSTTTNYQVAHNGAGFPSINGGPITYDQWVHLCVERYNGTITLYKDGSSVNSFASTATLNGVGSNFYIGTTGDSIGTGYLNGWIQDFRVTVGKARYQGAFTKPAAPLKG